MTAGMSAGPRQPTRLLSNID
jgi:hypothetical protein